MATRANTRRAAVAFAVLGALLVALFLWSRSGDVAQIAQGEVSAPVVTPSGLDADPTAALASPSAVSRTATAVEVARADRGEPTAAPSGPSRLHGTVRPAPGRSEFVGDVGVGATDAFGNLRKVLCAKDGTYAFEDIEPGRYWLTLRSPQNGRANVTVDVRGDTLRDIQLEAPRAVAIRVVDEIGKPTKELAVFAIATPEPPGDWSDDVRGGQQNPVGCGFFRSTRFPFAEGPPEIIGHVHLDRAPPVYISLCKYQRVLETRRVEGDVELLDFVLRTDDERLASGGIRLRAVDAESRAPLEKVGVTASSDATRFGGAVAGIHTFEGLNPGTHRLQLMKKDYATLRMDVRVLPGQVNDLGDVPLSKGHWVAGRILDETGEGAKSSIRFDPCEPDGRVAPVFGAIWTFPTNADGTFRVPGLTPGFHRLEVMSESDEDSLVECVAVFDLRNGPVENVTLTITSGVPFVVDPDGHEGPGARFAVLDEKDVRVVSRTLPEPTPVRVRLAPGRYTVEFKSSRGDPDPRTAAFEIVRDPVVVRMR